MNLISQNLAMAVGLDGKPANGWSLPEVTRMYQEAFEQFEETPVGQELLRRGGTAVWDQILRECEARFEHTSPALTPFYETLEQIGKDLLVTLPPEKVVAAPKLAPKAKPAPPAPEPSSELKKFAYLVNDETLNRGVPKLVAGFYTLTGANGARYQYPRAEYLALMEEAISFNLIR